MLPALLLRCSLKVANISEAFVLTLMLALLLSRHLEDVLVISMF